MVALLYPILLNEKSVEFSAVGYLLVCSWRVNFCWEHVVTPGLYLMYSPVLEIFP